MLVVGIVLAIIHNRVYFKEYSVECTIMSLSVVFIVIGAAVTVGTASCVIANVSTYDVDYQNKLHEKEMLEYRIEHMEENITGNEMLYNDIVEFNNELRSTKKWANSPWTNWFNNQDIASIDYIELDED